MLKNNVYYTFEDTEGNAETVNSIEETTITPKDIIGTVFMPIAGIVVEVPLLKGYYNPYDWVAEDALGLEHYIYYNEK